MPERTFTEKEVRKLIRIAYTEGYATGDAIYWGHAFVDEERAFGLDAELEAAILRGEMRKEVFV